MRQEVVMQEVQSQQLALGTWISLTALRPRSLRCHLLIVASRCLRYCGQRLRWSAQPSLSVVVMVAICLAEGACSFFRALQL